MATSSALAGVCNLVGAIACDSHGAVIACALASGWCFALAFVSLVQWRLER